MPLISTGYGYADKDEEEERLRKWTGAKLPPLPDGGIQPRMKPPTPAETKKSVVRAPAQEGRSTVSGRPVAPPAMGRIDDGVTRAELTQPQRPAMDTRQTDEEEPTPDRYETGPSGGIPIVGYQGPSAPGYQSAIDPWRAPGQQSLPPVAMPIQPYQTFVPLPTPDVSQMHEMRGVMFPRQGGAPTGEQTQYGNNFAGQVREQGLGPALRETAQDLTQRAGQSNLVQGLRTPEGRQYLGQELVRGAASAFSPTLAGMDPNNPQAGVYGQLEAVRPGEKTSLQQRFDQIPAGQYFNEIQARREQEIARNMERAGEADLKWWERTKPGVWIQRVAETSWRTLGSTDADELAYLAFGESPISTAPTPGEERGPTIADAITPWVQPIWERVRFRVGKQGPEYDPATGAYSSPWNKDWRVLDYFKLRPSPQAVAEKGRIQAEVDTLLARTDQLIQAREQLRDQFQAIGKDNPELYTDLAAIQGMAYTDAYRSSAALDVALSVPYWKEDLQTQRDQLRVTAAQMEAAGQYEQAEMALVEAGRVGAFLNELNNTSTADIIEHYTNWGAELASSPIDPMDFALGKVMDATGLGLRGIARALADRRLANMTGEAASEIIEKAAARGDTWVQQAQSGTNIGHVFAGLGKRVQRAAQEQGPLAAVREMLILPANTPATAARNSTEILSNTLSMMMSNSGIENKSVVREILSRMATVEGRKELVDGIADPLGNMYKWGPGLIGNEDIAREYKVLDMMGPRWVDDLQSLAGEGAVNHYELQSEITQKLHEATRHMYGATRDSVLPWGTRDVRVAQRNGRSVVEYLDANGQIVRRSQPMTAGQAGGILQDAQKALGKGGMNPFKVIANVRNAIMADMFLALRPANAIRQSTAQTLMMQAYDAYSTVGHKEIVRRMADMFDGGAPTVRMLEGMGAFELDSRGVGGYGAIDYIARTITRNPENAVSRFMRRAYDLPYGHTEIRLGKRAIGIADDSQNEKAFFKTMQNARNTMWPEYVRGAWDTIMAEAGLTPEQSKGLRQLVEAEGKVHNKAAIARAVDDYLSGQELPNLLHSLELPDDVITPDAQRQIERVLQNAGPEDREIVARRIGRIFESERKRYQELLGLARPDFEEIPWTDQEIAHGAADIADMLMEDARRANIPDAEARRTADRIAGQWARQQRAAVDRFRSDLADVVGRQSTGGRAASAPGGGPPPIGNGMWDAVMDFWRDLYDTRVAARLEVDEASRLARSQGTSQAWARKFRETGEIWERFGREFDDIGQRYSTLIQDIARGNSYQGKTNIDDILRKYVTFDEDEWKRVQQIELGGVNDTGEDLWQQVIDYHRDYLDNAFTEVAMAFRRFPSMENFDVMIQALRQVDEMGSQAAQYVATHRDAMLAGRLTKGQFYQIRNLTWNQFFREAAPESLRYMERAMIMNGLLDGEGTKALRWVDEFAGRFQLNRPLGKGVWEAINVDTGDLERVAEPGRLEKYPREPRGAGFARSEIQVQPDQRENMTVVPQDVIDRYLAMTDNAAQSVDDVAQEIRREANKVAPVLPDDHKEAIAATPHPMKIDPAVMPAQGYFDAETALRELFTPSPLDKHLDVMDWVSQPGLANNLAATDRAAAYAKLKADTRGPAEFLHRAVEASRVGPLFGGQLPDQPARDVPSHVPNGRQLENLARYAGYATADRRGRGNQAPRILNSARAAGVPIPKGVNSLNSLTDSEATALGVFLQNRASNNMRQIYRNAWAQILPADQLAAHMNLADAHAAADARITGRHPSQWWAEHIAGMTRDLPTPERAEDIYRRLFQAAKAKVPKISGPEMGRRLAEAVDKGLVFSPAEAMAMMGDKDLPDYLLPVGEYLLEQQRKLLNNELRPRDYAKAYYMTIASQGARGYKLETVNRLLRQVGVTVDGEIMQLGEEWVEPAYNLVRAEDLAARWLWSDAGQEALADMDRGIYNEAAWLQGFAMRDEIGDGRIRRLNVYGDIAPLDGIKKAGMSTPEFFQRLADEPDIAKKYDMLIILNGVSEGKHAFMGHLVGMGQELTKDVREYNLFLTGFADLKDAAKAGISPDRIMLADALGSQSVQNKPYQRPGLKGKRRLWAYMNDYVDELYEAGYAGDLPRELAGAIIHHRQWDAVKGEPTMHASLWDAMRFAQSPNVSNGTLPEGLEVVEDLNGSWIVGIDPLSPGGTTLAWEDTRDAAIRRANQELQERAKIASLRSGRPVSTQDVIRRPNWVAALMGESVPGDPYGTDALSRTDRMQSRRLWIGERTNQEFDWDTQEWVISHRNQEIARSPNRYTALREGHNYLQNTPGLQPDYAVEYAYRNLQDAILEGTARGAVTFLDDGRALIHALNQPDISTAMHEMSHVWLEEIRRKAPQYDEYADMWQKIRRAYEIQPGRMTREQWADVQERWATDFERYLQDGKAPTKYLQHIFEQFKRWMFDVYRRLQGSGEVHPEIRQVFDSLLASDEELAAYQTVDRGFEDLPLFLRSGEDPLPDAADVTPEPVIGYTREGQGEMFGAGEDLPMFTGQGMAAEAGEFTPQEVQSQAGMFDMRPRMGEQEPSYLANSLEADPPPLPPDDVLQDVLTADVEFTAGSLARYPDGSLWYNPQPGVGPEFKQAMDAGDPAAAGWRRVSRPMNTAGGKESATARKLRSQVDADLLPQYPWEYIDLGQATAPGEWVDEASNAIMLEALEETAEEMRTRYIEEGQSRIDGAWSWDRLIRTARQKDLVQGQSGRRIADRDTGQFAERRFEGGRIAEQAWFVEVAGQMFPSTGNDSGELINFIDDYLALERRIDDLKRGSQAPEFTRMSAREIADYGIETGLYDAETAEQWLQQGREGIINLTTAAEGTDFEGVNMAWELPSKTRLNKMRKADLSQLLVENQIVTPQQASRSSKRELVQLAEEARSRPMSERAGGRTVDGYRLYQQSADSYMDLNPNGPIPPWQQAWMAMRAGRAAPPAAQGTPGGQFRHQLHMLDSAENAIMGQLDGLMQRRPNTLTMGQKTAVRNGVAQLLPGHDDVAASAAMQGKFVADWILPNNYERRYLDSVLGILSPFHYFTTRAAIRGTHAAMQSPWLLDLYYRGERAIEKRNERDPQATRTSNAINVGGITLPNGESYSLSLGNPLSWIVPYSMYAPNPYVEPDAARNDFERWYYKMLRYSPVRPGPFSQMALSSAGIGDQSQLSDLVPIARMVGYARMAQDGKIGGPGILRLGDEWDYGRAGREIALMVERKDISPEMAAWAQDVGYQILNQTGPLPDEPEQARLLWEAGVKRMAINRGIALLAGWMLGVPIYTYSDTERDIRAKASLYGRMGYQGEGQPLGRGSEGGSRTAQKAYLQEIDQVLRPWWAYRVLYPGEAEQQQTPAPQQFYYKQPTEEYDRPAVQAQRIEYYNGRDQIYEESGELIKAWIEANPVTADTDVRDHRSQFRDFQDQVYALQSESLDELRAQYGNEITEYNTTYDMMRNMDPDEINRRIGEQAYREAKDELADLRPPETDWDSLTPEDRRAQSAAWDTYNDAVDRLMAAKLNDRQWLVDTTWGRPLGASAAENAEARLTGTEAPGYDVPGFRIGPSAPIGADVQQRPTQPPTPAATEQPDVPYGQQFATAAEHYNLDPKMLAAVALAESSFDPQAVSGAGARGLMQIMPTTWQQAVDAGLEISDPMNPTHSIAAGAYYLDWLRKTLPEDKRSDRWVLAAYNWGPGNVMAAQSWRDVPAETRAYADHVINESGRMIDAASGKAEAARQEALSLRLPFKGDYQQTQAYGASPEAYSRFGLTGHDGVDWSMPEGTPVAAAADGIVERIGWDPNGYGTYMVVNHGGGYSTLYAHLSNTQLQQGQAVAGGDVIALSGNTGNSTGPHLHMGLIVEGSEGGVGYNRQDPSPYLEQLAVGGGTQLPTGTRIQAPVANAGEGQIVRSTAPPWEQTQQTIRDRYSAKFQTPEQRQLESLYDQFDANEQTRIDSLYPGGTELREQYSNIVSDEDRAAFKAANPEINLINLATYNQATHDQALELFGAAAMQEWARRPDWTQTEARREYYRQHPRSWTVNAWLTGRPSSSDTQDDFTYNAGADYEQARQQFGQDIFTAYERYLALDKDGRRAFAKADGRIYDFQDWWYALLNDEEGAGSAYGRSYGYGGWYGGGGGYGGYSGYSGGGGTPSQYYRQNYRELNYDLQPQAAGRAGLGAWRQWDVDRPYVPRMGYPDVRLWQPRIG